MNHNVSYEEWDYYYQDDPIEGNEELAEVLVQELEEWEDPWMFD